MTDEKQKTIKNRASRAAVLLHMILAIAVLLSACGGAKLPINQTETPTEGPAVTQHPDAETTRVEDAASTAGIEDSSTEAPAEDDFTIVPTAASVLKLVEKDTEAFTMQIPEGWEIRYGWDGEKMLLIRVYDPANPVNQIFYATDMVPFMKSEASAKAYAVSGMTVFSEAPILDPPTNETLFQQIPKLRAYYADTMKMENAAEMIPEIYDFTLLETLAADSAFSEDSLDDSIIYGSFKTADGSIEGEGIGFASIVDLFGALPSPLSGVDLAYYNVYHFTVITAAKDEFVNYEDVLCRSFASLSFKQEFIDQTLKNSENSFAELQKINASITASYYSYNAAWLSRSQSSDISRQKWSDATLGYERVYDTDTGEIYKAYNGFTDDYTGSRYLPISDEMYTQGWSGYIEP